VGPVLARLKDLAHQQELPDLEDIFFSAGLDCLPAYRLGLIASIEGQMLNAICALGDLLKLQAENGREPDPRLPQIVGSLVEAYRLVELFDTTWVKLPKRPTGLDVFKELAPMVVQLRAAQQGIELPAEETKTDEG
jgi:hypothetical protein